MAKLTSKHRPAKAATTKSITVKSKEGKRMAAHPTVAPKPKKQSKHNSSHKKPKKKSKK